MMSWQDSTANLCFYDNRQSSEPSALTESANIVRMMSRYHDICKSMPTSASPGKAYQESKESRMQYDADLLIMELSFLT